MTPSRAIPLISIFIFLATWSCKEPYTAHISGGPPNYLVVDAFINSGGVTTINLSRTRSLSDSVNNIPEDNAQVTVEGDGADLYPVYGQGNGAYVLNYVNLNPSEKYRLRIQTGDGSEYLSDFVDVKQTPPIDSVFFEKQADGIHVYVDTHDQNFNSKYYQWDFVETWEYTASFYSYLEYIGGQLVTRPPQNLVYRCWHNQPSTAIFLGSSAGLSEDVISHFELVLIPTGSEKPWIRYSINVNQRVLTQDGYQYWQTLKRNTEQLGTLFDAQPSQLTGNIHCTTRPAEPVIGFVSAATSSTQRIFIEYSQIMPWVLTDLSGCQYSQVPLDHINQVFGDTLATLPLNYHYTNGILTGIDGADIECADCRTKGGTNVKPSFWP